jgi:hypothetical protein
MRKDEVVPQGTGTVREIDRRTVAKGVAWTVPVVIVATAAPAAAASRDMHVEPGANLGAASGQSGYEIEFTVTSHGIAGTLTMSIPAGAGWQTTSGSTSVTANGTAKVKLIKKKKRDAETVTVSYSYTPTGGQTVSGLTQAVMTPATPA